MPEFRLTPKISAFLKIPDDKRANARFFFLSFPSFSLFPILFILEFFSPSISFFRLVFHLLQKKWSLHQPVECPTNQRNRESEELLSHFLFFVLFLFKINSFHFLSRHAFGHPKKLFLRYQKASRVHSLCFVAHFFALVHFLVFEKCLLLFSLFRILITLLLCLETPRS